MIPTTVTQTLVDCLKEDVHWQRELQQQEQYEPDMLEGLLNEIEPSSST